MLDRFTNFLTILITSLLAISLFCAFALAEELPALCEKLGIEDLGAYCGSLDLD